MNRKSQQGVALVITLIMLAMVTLMAVLFLGISRRERASVSVTAESTSARMAAGTGQTRAIAEIVARIAGQTNLFAYDFLVSTNFLSPQGFLANLAAPNLTNVSYVYAGSGQPIGGDDLRKNLLNLYYDPRPPVFVVTNNVTGASEFRFYLDLNRNGRFDTNGIQRVFNTNGVAIAQTNFYWGDPEWIGILEHPDRPHSPTNRFIGRYAFLVVPAGKTLDINFMHNNAQHPSDPLQLGYLRNQGVGPWEINLAAFFRDLNTNVWKDNAYSYAPDKNLEGGFAFRDAFSILTNRYWTDARRWGSLKSANQTFFGRADKIIQNDLIDEYSDGPLMLGFKPVALSGTEDNPTRPWSGSYNTNGYSSIQELFDPTKTSPAFVSELQQALTNSGSYNQNTFYRLMSQLGTDSLPANRNQLNLNFVNVSTTGAIDPSLVASFQEWTPLGFFTNAADMMLRQQSGGTLALTRIPIYPTNRYSASLHRLLQLAANIGDARTNWSDKFLVTSSNVNYYAPSVFRPLFTRQGTNVFISGYKEVTNNAARVLAQPWVDLNRAGSAVDASGIYGRDLIATDSELNVMGIPYVIGVKKGLPNFNEYLLETTAFVTRRLKAVKANWYETNNISYHQSYQFSITNSFAAEAWNSYTQAFPRQVTLILTNRASMVLSNGTSRLPIPNPNVPFQTGLATNIGPGTWAGWNPGSIKGPSFEVPMDRSVATLPEMAITTAGLVPGGTNSPSFEPVRNLFIVPDVTLNITNRLQFALIDNGPGPGNGRLLDFVNLDGLNTRLELTRNLVGNTDTNRIGTTGGESTNRLGMFWMTNRTILPTRPILQGPAGVSNQVYASIVTNFLSDDEWRDYSHDRGGQSATDAIRGFRNFLGLNGPTNVPPGKTTAQVPFTPTRQLHQELSWSANDPLVHYHIGDLTDPDYTDPSTIQFLKPHQTAKRESSTIADLNHRFRPWGGNPRKDHPSSQTEPPDFGISIKDPLIRKSDDWDFPTNKFPNIGWLGRVHRGTPWQTVYLKSESEPTLRWAKWAGPAEPVVWNGRLDSHPTNDWALLDLFTTALNDNAARGLLSVNQTNMAAWSAVLSGVPVLTNALSPPQPGGLPVYPNLFIQPASRQLEYIVTNINATRLQQPGQVFQTMGSVLASRALTVASPYLNTSQDQLKNGIRDEVYERIPQQILSLLKPDEPYVVIYSFGQALRPAQNSVSRLPGPSRGLCTNYQVTAEMVTKTAVRIVRDPQQPRIFKAVVEGYNILPAD